MIVKHKGFVATLLLCLVFLTPTIYAQPYGKGKYGTAVPYGSETSLTISTGSASAIQVTPDTTPVLGTTTNDVTITSLDVVGYKLYVRSIGSTDMTNSPSTIPASVNAVPGALAVNTWGYNTDASTDFVGMTTSDVLVKNATGPYSAGDLTTFTYGVKLDNSKPAGNYTTSIVYTAVPQTD